jgi:hypothetical protein
VRGQSIQESKLSTRLFGMSKRESGQRRATEDAENDDSLTAEKAQGIGSRKLRQLHTSVARMHDVKVNELL